MGKKNFFSLSLWDRFSRKMQQRLETLRSAGFFTPERAEESRLFLAKACHHYEDFSLTLYLLVDPQDGMIADAKYQGYADSALLALTDITCSFIIGKTYLQVERTTKELLIKQFSEEKESFGFPEELEDHLQLIRTCLMDACQKCHHIPLEVHSPLAQTEEGKESAGYPLFLTLSKAEKLSVIENVLNEEIRPYVALDEGGVEIVDLNNHELTIAYKGSCTSCYSSVGSTLSAIQGILQDKVHPSLQVVPNLDNLQLP